MKIEEVNKKIRQLAGEGKYKFLLTVSGGADSIAMLDIFATLKYDFIIAHCNFNLRGEESNRDEAYVRKMAHKYDKPLFVESYQTEAYAKENSISIEMAARDLRYSWFNTLRQEQGCDYIVVAHHMGDVTETIFINMLRGTGLRGLSGISEKAGHIIRPLLSWGREDILTYLQTKGVAHCNDSSNDTTDYTRNKVRHNIIPHFQDINPSFLKTMLDNSRRMADAELLYLSKVQEIRSQITKQEGDSLVIDIASLKDCIAPNTVLYEILKDYRFSGKIIEDIIESLDGLSGKHFVSSKYKIVKDRNQLIVYPLHTETQKPYLLEDSINEPLQLKLEHFDAQDYTIQRDRNIACFDAEKIHMPLMLRKWKQGDIFHPFGMKGKKKKVSDYFTDHKFSLKDKEDCWILESQGQIIWIVSHRTDEKFRISQTSRRVLQISIDK